jgi:hypothetical protein
VEGTHHRGCATSLSSPASVQQSSVRGSSTEGLPITPSMGPTLESILTPRHTTAVDGRVVFITLIAVAIGLAAGLIAQILLRLIGLITNLSFYGRLSPQFASPTGNHSRPVCDRRPGNRWSNRRFNGALWVRGDSRAWNS